MRILKIIFLLFMAIGLYFPGIAQREYTRDYHKAFDRDAIKKIKMDCRFGNIYIVNDTADSVRFDVQLSVNAQSEDIAEKLLNLIEIKWDSIVPVVGAKTKIDPAFRPKEGFSIDFRITVPSDRELELETSFGKINIDSLQAPGKFTIEHGSFEGQYLNFPADQPGEFNLSYSKMRLNEFSNANVTADFSKIFAGYGEDINILGSYSGWGLDSIETIRGTSSNDSFQLLWTNDLHINAKKSNFNIRSVGQQLKCSNNYGTCIIEGFSDQFNMLDIDNKYGNVFLNISQLSQVFYEINTFQSNVLIPQDMEIYKNVQNDRTMYLSDEKYPDAPTIRIKSDYGAVELDK